ncbi:aldolase/citrate lyase family protein [Streptomyces sp. M19]
MARLNSVIDALESGGTPSRRSRRPTRPRPLSSRPPTTTAWSSRPSTNPGTPHAAGQPPVPAQPAADLRGRHARRVPTPLVRVPVNGAEHGQWHAKQALDLGAYGIVWPHISRVEEARNAVAACRYPRLPGDSRYEPAGLRGDAPTAAARYWGLPNQEYYARADVWPLAPDGEILVVIQIEDQLGIQNLPEILDQVPGIGLVLIGEGDLSQELGVPRQLEHPLMVEARSRIVEICHGHGVVVGHPHVTAGNVRQVLDEGYRFLMSAPVRSYPGLELGRRLTGRS